ncbi:MAG: DUF86 domain-containing protein [Candidatus Brockarchaeota archaeon]|nr:DUF86 domain-containing protein [Candidatus Brockarchaeota archaeon]
MKLDLEGLSERLRGFQDLKLLILFGSLAEGVEHGGSDVDVVIDAPESTINLIYDELGREFRKREIHMIRVGWLRPEALLHIARRGIVLLDRGVLSQVALSVSSDYFDLREGADDIIGSWLRGDPIDVALIMTIMEQVDEDVKVLMELTGRLNDVLADPILRRAFERSLHTAIEGMLDMLRHIVSRLAPRSFETYRELVGSAERLGVVGGAVAGTLKGLMDARHTLIHRYRGITDNFLKDCLNKTVTTWQTLREEIRAYLSKCGEPSVDKRYQEQSLKHLCKSKSLDK